MNYLGKLKIVLCDANKTEMEDYAVICRDLCKQLEISADVKLYSSKNELMFDMKDIYFSAQVGIFIIDPENGFDKIPSAIRKEGYDGPILYLSHSSSVEYYRQAFNVGAYNFVQKSSEPQKPSQFQTILKEMAKTAEQNDRKFFVVSNAGEYRKIEINKIYYFETLANHMINIVYKGGSFAFLSSLQDLEKRFRKRGFVRVHRSYLVSVDSIHRVEKNELTLYNKIRIPVSRSNAPMLKEVMYC